jgi:hypothetical protein
MRIIDLDLNLLLLLLSRSLGLGFLFHVVGHRSFLLGRKLRRIQSGCENKTGYLPTLRGGASQ